MCQHMLQGSESANRIEIVVVADVCHPEKLALHFPLPVGHDRVERFSELFYVLTPAIEVEVGRTETGDRVHDEQSVIPGGTNQLRDAIYVVPSAGGCLRRLHVYRTNVGREPRTHFIERESLAVRLAECVDLATVCLAQSRR